MKYHLSFDDYCEENYLIAKLLLKYGLQATFFIELEKSGDRRNPMVQVKAISDMGFDIGCHSLDHPNLKNITSYELEIQTFYAKDLLENIVGKECTWYCPPKGKYNIFVINKILEAGFKYIRTVDVLDTSDLVVGINKTSVHAYPRREYEERDWLDVAREQIDNVLKTDGCFKFWGHGWEIDKHKDWEKLEALFKYIGEINNTEMSKWQSQYN